MTPNCHVILWLVALIVNFVDCKTKANAMLQLSNDGSLDGDVFLMDLLEKNHDNQCHGGDSDSDCDRLEAVVVENHP